jgi:hypothetical protein
MAYAQQRYRKNRDGEAEKFDGDREFHEQENSETARQYTRPPRASFDREVTGGICWITHGVQWLSDAWLSRLMPFYQSLMTNSFDRRHKTCGG